MCNLSYMFAHEIILWAHSRQHQTWGALNKGLARSYQSGKYQEGLFANSHYRQSGEMHGRQM